MAFLCLSGFYHRASCESNRCEPAVEPGQVCSACSVPPRAGDSGKLPASPPRAATRALAGRGNQPLAEPTKRRAEPALPPHPVGCAQGTGVCPGCPWLGLVPPGPWSLLAWQSGSMVTPSPRASSATLRPHPPAGDSREGKHSQHHPRKVLVGRWE